MKGNYAKLFEPFTFKSGAKSENRFLMAPMTTASSFENGMITTDELMYYTRRSGGVGAVITACAHVREDGKFKPEMANACLRLRPVKEEPKE